MNDVARMYFELEAIYKESKKAPKRPLDDVLLSYATQVGTGITAEEAREMCKANAPFFLSHCRKEEAMHASDVQWSHTKFFRFLSQECKGILDILEQRESQSRRGHTNLPPTSRRPTPPPPAPKRKRSPLVESFLRRRPQPPGADSAAAAARRHGRAERIVPHIMDHEMADVDEPSLMPPSPEMAAEIEVEAVRRMLDVFEEIWHEHESSGRAMEKITKTTIHSRMFFKCSLDYQTPALITGYYSQSLLKSLPEKWEVTAFFEYLEEMAINPNRTLGKLPLHHVLKKLSRRKAQQHQQRVTATGASMSQETNTPSSVDGSRGRKKNRLAQASDVDPSEAMDVETPESQSMPRDTPQLRQPGRKRKTRPLDQDVKPAGKTPRLRLAARKRGLSDDEMEPLDFSRISRAAQETPIIYSDDSDDDSLPEPEIPIVIRTENIPSVIPRGPEGTWVCEEPGCKFIVRDADEASGKAEVDMHIESHGNNKEDEKERLLSYAVLEGNRNHLPVRYVQLLSLISETISSHINHGLSWTIAIEHKAQAFLSGDHCFSTILFVVVFSMSFPGTAHHPKPHTGTPYGAHSRVLSR